MNPLIEFLDDLKSKISDNTISDYDKLQVIDLYMRLTMDQTITEDIDEKKLLKYLSMGWYIYSQLKET